MEIIDLTEEYQEKYFVCLEDWSEEMKEAGNHKELWCNKMKDKGLRVKLAIDDNKVCGMVQYVPVEYSFIDGKDLYFIHCIWVHGYKKGVGNYQKKGVGKALLQAAENDVKSLAAKGIAAWGISWPFWMKASWFKKQGYTKVDKDGTSVLLWKPFADDAIPPKWIKEKKKPGKKADKVLVTSFINGWCPAQNMVFERAKRAASEFGDKVEFQRIHTFDRDVFLEWGIADALFIDGKQIRTGPPPSYEKIRKKIARRVKKLVPG
ncbi:MAG: GNAT family N-acetyltransferase [Candidatus Aminicenantes bacterium]|nr:GNAT family N-acetyltransferase [Candidatus Aminicenantes bacterium]MDH5384365.1 GNAT family N-acetyltransferase [Candidatus Aminicenantes bacterium]MDH5743849.1 GNAT family N-acetyltransferase [Candidatus Aminicenantes bacterium]